MRRICWSFSAERGAGLAALAVGLAVLAGCGRPAADDSRLLMLGDACYRVPAQSLIYFDSKTRRYATLSFANESVRAAVPGYTVPRALANGMRDTFSVGVSAPNEAEAAGIRERERTAREETFHDLWYGIHEFSGRVVEPIEGTSLSRVRPLAGSATWMVVSRAPDAANRVAHTEADFWVASCAQIDDAVDRCTARLEDDGVRMTMYTTEKNLDDREVLSRYVIDSMAKWRSGCGQNG